MRKESIVTETLAQNQEFTVRCQRVLQVAKQLFQGRPDWVTFFREVLGVNGAARNVFPVSYTHLRAHETKANLVCRLLL